MDRTIERMLDCMTIAVGKNASATGRVLLAHNEDDYTHALVSHYYVPAADWPQGTRLPAEDNAARLEQLPHTFGYWWSQVRGPEGGLSTSDSFLNENGVCVVSDSSCGSREAAQAKRPYCGGIQYELRRAVAERAKSARHGLEVALELIKRYGYGSDGRIYFIADKDECFVLQLARGRYYLAARLPDDAIAVMPNHYTLHSLHDAKEMYYPDDLVSHAIEKGWYVPAMEDQSDFDFAAAYQDEKTYRHSENTLRQHYAQQLLLGREWDDEKEGYPFCIRRSEKLGVRELMKVMSTHYEGTPDDVRFGPGQSPHDTRVRRVCTGTTVEAQVYEFTEGPLFTTVWTAFGRPCEQPYIPLHPLCGVPVDLGQNADPLLEAARHFDCKPGATAHKSGYWQLFQDYQNLLECRYSAWIGRASAVKEALLARFEEEEKAVRANTSALDQAGLLEALRGKDKNSLRAAADAVCRMMYVDQPLANAKILSAEVRSGEKFSARVTFAFDGEPLEEELMFGPGRTEMNHQFGKVVKGSLLGSAKGVWQAEFIFDEQPLKKDGAGRYEFILGGKSADDAGLAAICLMEMHADGCAELASYWHQGANGLYVAAHRGWSDAYPENTMEAFVAAVALGVDQIETDVHASKDGELVLMHDGDVSRTTDGEGKVGSFSLNELKQLDAGLKKDASFSGARVPTLKELLALAARHPFLTLDVELKDYPEDGDEDRAYRICDSIIALIDEYGMRGRVVFNTFSGKLHDYMKEKYGSSLRRHEYYPPKHMGKGDDHDYEGAYCCCMFATKGGPMASEKEMDDMWRRGVQPWAGASVKTEEDVLCAMRNGASLITCNDPAHVLYCLRVHGKHD